MVEQAIKQFIEQTKGQVQPAVLLPMGWRGDIPVDAFAIRSTLVTVPVVTGLEIARGFVYGSVHVQPPLPVKLTDGVQVAPLGDDDDE